MKFLCLHGSGTNSSVLQAQLGPLRHELGEGYEYEFVEGVIRCSPTEGIEALSSPGHDFYAFFDPADLSTLQTAVTQLDQYITAEGPYDAILGFSAGSTLAAMYILQKQANGLSVPLKCAVFLSAAEIDREIQHLGMDLSTCRLSDISTVHIWGANDRTAPTGGQVLSSLCDPANRFTFIHDGRHELPRGGETVQACHVIRRAAFRISRMMME
ncbi:serine hydrolase FSH [Xylariaceae sp. FL1019]|nr:serine hydrolase FSH [Xylariaceae sp. FL1019]